MITRQMFTETSNEACTGVFLLSANEVCEGYVFTGVCLSARGGGCPGPGRGVCPRGCQGPGPRGLSRPRPRGCPGPGPEGGCIPACTEAADGYCCGRYASYWNVFLLESLEFQCKWVSVFFVACEQSFIYIFPAEDVSRSCFGKFTDLDTTFRLSFNANELLINQENEQRRKTPAKIR